MKLVDITVSTIIILAIIFAYFRIVPTIQEAINSAPAAANAIIMHPVDAFIDGIPLFIVLIIIGFMRAYLRSSNGIST